MLCYRCGSFTPDDSRKCQVCGQPIASRRRPSTKLSAITTGQLRHIPPFDPGELVVNRYRVVEPSSPGATGWVLRARDEEVDVDVALKVISANLLQTEEERTQFQRAVKSARKVNHPNVVRIYDDGRADRYLYYTMPFLEGLSLRKIIDLRLERQQVFSLGETMPLFAQLALAADNLTKHGAHGAIRPSNITVLPDVLKLTGLPHHRGMPRKPFVGQLISAQAVDYLAPEARREDGELRRSADVYSLAVIFAEMITGVVYGRDVEAWAAAEEKLPPRMVATFHRAFASTAESRFETAAAFFEVLAESAVDMQGAMSSPAASASLDERERTDADADQSVAPTMDLSGSRRAPKSALSKRQALPRELSRGARRAAAAAQIERRGVAHKTSASVPFIAAAILLTGLAVSAAVFYVRQRANIDDLLPVQDGQEEVPPSTTAPVEPSIDKPDRPVKGHKAPPAVDRDRDRDRRDRDKGKRADARRPDRDPEPAVAPSPPAPAPTPTVTPPPPPPPQPPPTPEPVARVTPPPPPSPTEPVAAEPAGKLRCPPGMVVVDGGGFTFGAGGNDPMRGFGELAATTKTVDPFCIDIYEFPNDRGKSPTVNVSWTRAKRACERVNRRLCTELEWEHACKGPSDARFPYGNSYDPAFCNVGEGADDVRKPGPTGVFPRCRSGYGAVDMGGNVAEWTSSSWGRGMPDKVVKGGSADQAAYMSRCAARTNEAADGRQANIGFRCCAEPKR